MEGPELELLDLLEQVSGTRPSTLKDPLCLRSIQWLELLLRVESSFDLDIPDPLAVSWESGLDILHTITELRKLQP